MNDLKIYTDGLSNQRFEKYGDVWSAVRSYIRRGKRSNQQPLLKFMTFCEVPFDLVECYEVYGFGWKQNNDGTIQRPGKFAILRIHWSMDKDYPRWKELGADNYTPGIIFYLIEIKQDRFNQLFELFSDTRITIWLSPSTAQDHGGLDGANYELSFGDDFFLGVTYKWWEDTPGTWQPLADVAMAAKGLMDEWIKEHAENNKKS